MPRTMTQVRCPNCKAPVQAAIEQLIDVSEDPSAKARLLSGSLNAIRCPSCRYEGALASPLVYHDPAKELLLTYVSMELGLKKDHQERLLGQLINQAVNRLPPEQRKAYILQPQAMLTLQGMTERILAADAEVEPGPHGESDERHDTGSERERDRQVRSDAHRPRHPSRRLPGKDGPSGHTIPRRALGSPLRVEARDRPGRAPERGMRRAVRRELQGGGTRELHAQHAGMRADALHIRWRQPGIRHGQPDPRVEIRRQNLHQPAIQGAAKTRHHRAHRHHQAKARHDAGHGNRRRTGGLYHPVGSQ